MDNKLPAFAVHLMSGRTGWEHAVNINSGPLSVMWAERQACCKTFRVHRYGVC